jgi:hypothetical protein
MNKTKKKIKTSCHIFSINLITPTFWWWWLKHYGKSTFNSFFLKLLNWSNSSRLTITTIKSLHHGQDFIYKAFLHTICLLEFEEEFHYCLWIMTKFYPWFLILLICQLGSKDLGIGPKWRPRWCLKNHPTPQQTHVGGF